MQAFRVEVNARVAALLIGPGATRLQEIEAASRRRFFLVPKEDVHLDHFLVARAGQARDASRRRRRSRRARRSTCSRSRSASTIRRRPSPSSTATTSSSRAPHGFVGKKVKAQITRVLPGTAYATIVKTDEGRRRADHRRGRGREADAEAVRGGSPRRRSRRRRVTSDGIASDGVAPDDDIAEAPPKKKTRRGSRGGRKHKKTPTIHVPETRARARTVPSRRRNPSPKRRSRSPRRRSRSPRRPSPSPRRPSRRSPTTAPTPRRRRRRDTAEEEDAPRLARRPQPAQEAGDDDCRRSRRNDGQQLEFPPRGHVPAFRLLWRTTRSSRRRKAVRRQGRRDVCSWTSSIATRASRSSRTSCSSAATAAASSRRARPSRAQVVGHERGPKIRIGKYKAKSGYKRHTGFRSSLTRIEITGIGARKTSAGEGRSGRRLRAEEAARERRRDCRRATPT